MTTATASFAKYLTRATMISAVVAAGITMQPVHAAEMQKQQPVRVVQLQTVTVVGKRIPVVELERVVIVGKRLPATTVVAQRNLRPAV